MIATVIVTAAGLGVLTLQTVLTIWIDGGERPRRSALRSVRDVIIPCGIVWLFASVVSAAPRSGAAAARGVVITVASIAVVIGVVFCVRFGGAAGWRSGRVGGLLPVSLLVVGTAVFSATVLWVVLEQVWRTSPVSLFTGAGALGAGLIIVCRKWIELATGSFLVSTTRPFEVGDHIAVQSVEGTVIAMTWSHVVVHSRQGSTSIPLLVLLEHHVSIRRQGGDLRSAARFDLGQRLEEAEAATLFRQIIAEHPAGSVVVTVTGHGVDVDVPAWPVGRDHDHWQLVRSRIPIALSRISGQDAALLIDDYGAIARSTMHSTFAGAAGRLSWRIVRFARGERIVAEESLDEAAFVLVSGRLADPVSGLPLGGRLFANFEAFSSRPCPNEIVASAESVLVRIDAKSARAAFTTDAALRARVDRALRTSPLSATSRDTDRTESAGERS